VLTFTGILPGKVRYKLLKYFKRLLHDSLTNLI